jgi:hypothetical protein
MLERVSTVILALDGQGETGIFADYAQWEAARIQARRMSEGGDAAARSSIGAA